MNSSNEEPQVDLLESFSKCSVLSYFGDERYLRSFASRVRQRGIVTIGELLARGEDDVFRIAPTTNANKDRVKRTLKEAGLEFKK